MGFSALGLAVSLAVLLPNLLLLALPPSSPLPTAESPKLLIWIERLGQALCLALPSLTGSGSIAPVWAVLLGLALSGYWGLWIRYATLRTIRALYGSVCGMPVPMAILPVLAFLSYALMCGNPWIGVGAAVLAIGHIPMSLLRARLMERG